LTLQLVTVQQRVEVVAYVDRALRLTKVDRLAEDKAKTGVFTSYYACHPITDEEIPIWVADYVLMGYGSRVVMGVPGHDTRDTAFANKYDLPIIEVIRPERDENGRDGPSHHSLSGVRASGDSWRAFAGTVARYRRFRPYYRRPITVSPGRRVDQHHMPPMWSAGPEKNGYYGRVCLFLVVFLTLRQPPL
jgi:hypothetical protein